MLSWFTNESSIAAAINGTALTEKNILAVKHISNACLDENVEFNYFWMDSDSQNSKEGSEIRMAVWKMQEAIIR